jgi:hypothetical protein
MVKDSYPMKGKRWSIHRGANHRSIASGIAKVAMWRAHEVVRCASIT